MEVNETLRRIANDPRHSDITVTSFEEAGRRVFPNWRMGLVTDPEAIRNASLPTAVGGTFDPGELSGKMLPASLQSLQRYLENRNRERISTA